MDGSNGLAHFYVNNSTVSVSGTTSAAGIPYQIAFAPLPANQNPSRFLNHANNVTAAAFPDNYSPNLNHPSFYDSNLNDLIDRSYYRGQIQQTHPYSTSSPLSSISATLGEDEDEPEESRHLSVDTGGTNYSYFGNSTNFTEIGENRNFGSTTLMAPTAIVDVRAADSSSSLLDLDNCGGNEFQSRRTTTSYEGIRSKSNGGKHKKFKNPHLAQQQRRQANMRERRRMKSINHAFDGLRQKIPTLPYEKKLSKVDTLKLAINYIQFLQELIETSDGKKTNETDGETLGTENGDGPNRANGRGHRSNHNRILSSNAQQAKKIIIECRTAFSDIDGDTTDAPPLRGHSLSWSRVGEPNSHSLMTAKVWRPQPPQIQQPSDHSTVDGGD